MASWRRSYWLVAVVVASTGLVGYYPARKAAHLDPIAAPRFE